jgi:hypothetical protein
MLNLFDAIRIMTLIMIIMIIRVALLQLHILMTGLRILVAGVVITTIVSDTNLSAATIAAKLTNAASTVQAALVAAGFPAAMVGPATAATVANPTASPTLAPSAFSAIGDSNTKGKTDCQNIFDYNKNTSIKKLRLNLNGDNANILHTYHRIFYNPMIIRYFLIILIYLPFNLYILPF